jgi:cell fate regulator YaaT (PSP1 superfamily)
MPIHPLPQFEADLEADRRLYEKLKPPTSIVVRFGVMKLVGEFPYSVDAKPGCGSRLVIRTHRGIELGEMLTSTCPNAGCSKSVSRKEMLQYIEHSGGRDYPFFNQGKVLRLATAEDLSRQAQLDAARPALVQEARERAGELGLRMKIVDAEPILGGERLTFYFNAEERVDFRELVSTLAATHHTRIEMRQVGARDEARLVADYERCGQHCCCKQFLKVLKPVSMRSAKVQKATLDPLKISGRCGRLMCCLRYEDETYEDLRKRLPRKKSRVYTPDGWAIVLDTQILTQLALVKLESTGAELAVPVEELRTDGPAEPQGRELPDEADDLAGEPGPGERAQPQSQRPPDRSRAGPPQLAGGHHRPRPDRPPQHTHEQRSHARQVQPTSQPPSAPDLAAPPSPGAPTGAPPKAPPHEPGAPTPAPGHQGRRRRRRRRRGAGGPGAGGAGPQQQPPHGPPPPPPAPPPFP